MSGLFGGKETASTAKLPSYLEKASKNLINKATALTDKGKYTPYEGQLVATKNGYYDQAAGAIQRQDLMARENFSQADNVLDKLDRGGATYNEAGGILDAGHDKFLTSMNDSRTKLNDAAALGASTKSALGTYGSMVGDLKQSQTGVNAATDNAIGTYGSMVGDLEQSQSGVKQTTQSVADKYNSLPDLLTDSSKKASDLQLGTGSQVRDTLTGALTGAGQQFANATDLTNRAAAMDGTSTSAIADRMNPYADLVKKKNLDDWNAARAVAGTANTDAARAAGAFGGSRHGVVESSFQKDTGKGVQDITNTANMNAYDAAIKQLNADRGNLLTSGGQLSSIQSAKDASTLGLTGAMSSSAQADAALTRQLGLDKLGATKDSAAGLMTTAEMNRQLGLDKLGATKDSAAGLMTTAEMNRQLGLDKLGAQGQSAAGQLSSAEMKRNLGLDVLGAQNTAAGGLMSGEKQLFDMNTGVADRLQDQASTFATEGTAAAAARLGLQDQQFNQGLNYAKSQADLGIQDQASRQKKAADLLGIGKETRAIEQQKLDALKGRFDEKQNYDREELNFLSGIVSGVPYSQTTRSKESGGLGNALIGAGATIGGAMLSDKNQKKNRVPVDGDDVLASFARLPVDKYDYKETPIRDGIAPEGRRIGTMAQDFSREFGGDDKTIDIGQSIGALTAGVKALEERTREGGLPKRVPRNKKAA